MIDTLIEIFVFNNLTDFITFLFVSFALFFFIRIVKRTLLRKLKKMAKKTTTQVDDYAVSVLSTVSFWFYFILALYIAQRVILQIPEQISLFLDSIIWLIIAVQVTVMVTAVATRSVDSLIKQHGKAHTSLATMSGVIKIAVRLFVWIFATLVVLSNFNIDVTALIAGLGIGGIAFAFALQKILSDVFSTFAIFFDGTFKVGDYITTGTESGRVKHIGLKSTRITTTSGEELIVPNTELASARIANREALQKTRSSIFIPVDLRTKASKLRSVSTIIQDVAEKIEDVTVSRVVLLSFNEGVANFNVVFYVNTVDYSEYIKAQEDVLLTIAETLEKNGITLSPPTQGVVVKK